MNTMATNETNNTPFRAVHPAEIIKDEIKNFQEANDKKTQQSKNIWNEAKAVLRWNFTAIKYYLRKQGKSQINILILHLKELKRENKQSSELIEGWN